MVYPRIMSAVGFVFSLVFFYLFVNYMPALGGIYSAMDTTQVEDFASGFVVMLTFGFALFAPVWALAGFVMSFGIEPSEKYKCGFQFKNNWIGRFIKSPTCRDESFCELSFMFGMITLSIAGLTTAILGMFAVGVHTLYQNWYSVPTMLSGFGVSVWGLVSGLWPIYAFVGVLVVLYMIAKKIGSTEKACPVGK